MKILVISQYWWPENGVPQRRWSWLSDLLTRAGHEVTVLAPPPHYQRKVSLKEWWDLRRNESKSEIELGPSGETIIRSSFFPSGTRLTQRILNQAIVALGGLSLLLFRRRELGDFDPDLIIGTVPALPTAAVTWVSAFVMRVPYIIDLRDAWPDLLEKPGRWNESTGRPSLRERVLRFGPLQLLTGLTEKMLNFVLRNASGIVATSEKLALKLENDFRTSSRDGRPHVTLIRNVFPVQVRSKGNSNRNTESNTLNVLYAGTVGRAQNLSNAVAAVAIARELGVDVRLRIVGAGAAKQNLRRIASEAGAEVEFLSRRNADQLAEFYEWADTCLVHLTDWEPLSRAVPSKTYELMAQQMHITGVVFGETAQLISSLGAGDVVRPEAPDELASLWVELTRNRKRLQIDTRASLWVEQCREVDAPANLTCMLRQVSGDEK